MHFLQIPDLFNELDKSEVFINNVQTFYKKINEVGVSKTLLSVL